MFYSERRKMIKSGDLLAWETRHVGSLLDAVLKIDKRLNHTQWSHVGVALVLGGRVFCVEATPPAVRIMPLSKLGDFYHLPVNIPWREKYTEILLRHVGKPYSLNGWVKEKLGFVSDADDFYCSELAADFYKNIGIIDEVRHGITPDTLVTHLTLETESSGVYVSVDPGNFKE